MADVPVIFDEIVAGNGKRVGIITLNAEKKLNTLTLEMVTRIHGRLSHWIDDDDFACVVVKGAGERAFCAGGDVQALHRSATERPGGPCVYAEAFFEHEYRMDYLFHVCPKPVIAWGHGIVMGGGLGIMAGCSHRVVTETARLAMPEVTIALFPDVGAGWFFNKMPGNTGLFLALTGASFNAADGLHTGVASHFVRHEYLGAVMDALREQPWGGAPARNHGLVDEVLAAFDAPSREALPHGNVAPNRDFIEDLCRGEDVFAKVAAIRDMETEDPWMAGARDTLVHGSPLSVLLTYQHMLRTRRMSLADVFRVDLLLATQVVRYPEFAEGVRALLIDKDKRPQWRYDSLQTVPPGEIDLFFQPPWPENPLTDL